MTSGEVNRSARKVDFRIRESEHDDLVSTRIVTKSTTLTIIQEFSLEEQEEFISQLIQPSAATGGLLF